MKDDWLTLHLGKFLIAIFFIGLATVVVVVGFYLAYFHNDISTQHSTWGEFGGFFGGTLSPLLAFLALIALLFTLWVQSRELIATRDLLVRATEAQENSVKTLAKQTSLSLISARITANGHLIDNINGLITQYKDLKELGNPEYMKELLVKRDELVKDIQDTFDQAKVIMKDG